MRKSRGWFAILSILAGGFLFVSFFIEQPLVRTIGGEILLWAERLFAALLFFSIADTVILQVRKANDETGMRIVRIIGFGVFLAVLLLGLIKGPEDPDLNHVVYFVQQTIESALAGLVCLSLIYAMYRLPSQTPTALKAGFFIGLLVFLVISSGALQLISLPEIADRIVAWIRVIPQGCLTGLLLGIALGGTISGLRFIMTGKLSVKGDK